MSTARATTTPVPIHALRRGTRGFAAVVLFLTGIVVLAVAAFALPSLSLDRLALSWLIPTTIVFGVAHLVAVYGTIGRRTWAVPLTLYLLAIGTGAAGYGLLMAVTGADAFGSATGRSDVAGLLLWLIGSWFVAARFVVRGFAPPVGRVVDEAGAGSSMVRAAPAPAPDLRRRAVLASRRGSAA